MTRVLVVEDSPTQAEELRLILESAGLEVETAPDGSQGLARLQAASFDLMVSDIIMPGMTGYELCRAAKASPLTKHVPVLLLTTLADPMDIIQGLECGADNFLTKPYEAANLVARVRGMLDNKLMRSEGKLRMGVEIFFLGKKFTISSDKEQILDLLLCTFEDIVRTNRELQASEAALAAAKAKIEDYAHRLEGRVRVSEEKYRTLMEHANDAIFLIDLEGRTLEVNRQTEHLLDRPARDLVGRPFFDWVMPAYQDYAVLQFQKLLQLEHASISDLQLRRGGGAFVCADISAAIVQTEGRRFVMAIARDVTERNRLQHQVVLNEKLATVGTLAAGVAHEINNPTSVLLANLSLLKQQGGQNAEVEEMLRDCLEAGERIRNIVRDLKGFARIDDDDVASVNINERLDTTVRMAFNELRYRARIEKRLAPHLPEITASPGKLSQLFLNLVVNAAQAIEEGRVDQNQVTIATALEGDFVRIDITDTGKGIPPEQLGRIFDPFFTTKAVGVGTGLGLSICQDIVKRHNGELRVESTLGRGSTFSVYLPKSTGLEPHRPRELTPRPSCPRSKVLVVDDEPMLLKVYTRLLGDVHDVTVALGGRAAVELLSKSAISFDAIFCDLMMPDTDGVDLHRYVAEKFPGLEKRMVFISGGSFTGRISDFLTRVETAQLEKPFTLQDLERALTEVRTITKRPG